MKALLHILLLGAIPLWLPAQAVITAVFDADLPGGLPKGTEIYITQDIADLSLLGIGSANNGGGTNGVEFGFPAISVDSGSYVYIASDSASFRDFFGFNADYISVAMAINGDDAIELFWDSTGIDVFGEISVDGTGQPWEYTDGWAARKALTGPDGITFILQNWYFSGVAGLDGETSNGTAQNPVPLKSYTDTTMTGPDATVILQNLLFIPRDITIEIGQTVRWRNVETTEQHNVNGQQAIFPCNPQGFYSGEAELGVWEYDVTFNIAGVYDYQCDPHVAHGMAGTVTVVDPDAPEYPAYEISTMHTEDASGIADSVDVHCTLSGIVYGPNFRPAGLQFTIIDNTGDGINVFKAGADCYNVAEGDLIEVKGTIDQFSGLTEIIPDAKIEVLSSGNPLLDPLPWDDPLEEALESRFVALTNLHVDSIVATGSSGWNMFTSNPVQYLIRLDADLFTDVSIYELQLIDVVGIVGQFDSSEPYTEGYQLSPRAPSDIQIQVSTKNLPASSISMSPNPVQERLYFDTDLQIQKVTLYTSDGQLAFEAGQQNSIDMSALKCGAYVVMVQTDQGLWSSIVIRN